MKVLICGSREWTAFGAIANRLSALPGEHEEITVIHGGARGADRLGARAARMLGFTVLPAFRPDYERHGRYWAPKQRTLDMLDERPDLVLAFTLGTGGTQFAIDEARKRGIPVEVHDASPKTTPDSGSTASIGGTHARTAARPARNRPQAAAGQTPVPAARLATSRRRQSPPHEQQEGPAQPREGA